MGQQHLDISDVMGYKVNPDVKVNPFKWTIPEELRVMRQRNKNFIHFLAGTPEADMIREENTARKMALRSAETRAETKLVILYHAMLETSEAESEKKISDVFNLGIELEVIEGEEPEEGEEFEVIGGEELKEDEVEVQLDDLDDGPESESFNKACEDTSAVFLPDYISEGELLAAERKLDGLSHSDDTLDASTHSGDTMIAAIDFDKDGEDVDLETELPATDDAQESRLEAVIREVSEGGAGRMETQITPGVGIEVEIDIHIDMNDSDPNLSQIKLNDRNAKNHGRANASQTDMVLSAEMLADFAEALNDDEAQTSKPSRPSASSEVQFQAQENAPKIRIKFRDGQKTGAQSSAADREIPEEWRNAFLQDFDNLGFEK